MSDERYANIRFYTRKELLDTHGGWKEIIPHVRAQIDKGMSEVEGVACRSGCAHCCYLLVHALPHEVVDIVQYVRFGDHFTREARAEILDRLKWTVERVEGMTPQAYRDENIPCPFLADNKLCMIYSVRPVACRAFGSKDVMVCNLSTPDDGTQTFKVVPDSLLKLTATSGLFFTPFLKATLMWWQGFGVESPVEEGAAEAVAAIQAALDAGLLTGAKQ